MPRPPNRLSWAILIRSSAASGREVSRREARGREARGRSWSQGPTSAIRRGGLQKRPRRIDGAETRDSGESCLPAKRRGYFGVRPNQEPGPSPFL